MTVVRVLQVSRKAAGLKKKCCSSDELDMRVCWKETYGAHGNLLEKGVQEHQFGVRDRDRSTVNVLIYLTTLSVT